MSNSATFIIYKRNTKFCNTLISENNELFSLAGYLSHEPSRIAEESPAYSREHLDPYVASMLAREPAEVQRAIIGILSMLKSIAKGMSQ